MAAKLDRLNAEKDKIADLLNKLSPETMEELLPEEQLVPESQMMEYSKEFDVARTRSVTIPDCADQDMVPCRDVALEDECLSVDGSIEGGKAYKDLSDSVCLNLEDAKRVRSKSKRWKVARTPEQELRTLVMLMGKEFARLKDSNRRMLNRCATQITRGQCDLVRNDRGERMCDFERGQGSVENGFEKGTGDKLFKKADKDPYPRLETDYGNCVDNADTQMREQEESQAQAAALKKQIARINRMLQSERFRGITGGGERSEGEKEVIRKEKKKLESILTELKTELEYHKKKSQFDADKAARTMLNAASSEECESIESLGTQGSCNDATSCEVVKKTGDVWAEATDNSKIDAERAFTAQTRCVTNVGKADDGASWEQDDQRRFRRIEKTTRSLPFMRNPNYRRYTELTIKYLQQLLKADVAPLPMEMKDETDDVKKILLAQIKRQIYHGCKDIRRRLEEASKSLPTDENDEDRQEFNETIQALVTAADGALKDYKTFQDGNKKVTFDDGTFVLGDLNTDDAKKSLSYLSLFKEAAIKFATGGNTVEVKNGGLFFDSGNENKTLTQRYYLIMFLKETDINGSLIHMPYVHGAPFEKGEYRVVKMEDTSKKPKYAIWLPIDADAYEQYTKAPATDEDRKKLFKMIQEAKIKVVTEDGANFPAQNLNMAGMSNDLARVRNDMRNTLLIHGEADTFGVGHPQMLFPAVPNAAAAAADPAPVYLVKFLPKVSLSESDSSGANLKKKIHGFVHPSTEPELLKKSPSKVEVSPLSQISVGVAGKYPKSTLAFTDVYLRKADDSSLDEAERAHVNVLALTAYLNGLIGLTGIQDISDAAEETAKKLTGLTLSTDPINVPKSHYLYGMETREKVEELLTNKTPTRKQAKQQAKILKLLLGKIPLVYEIKGPATNPDETLWKNYQTFLEGREDADDSNRFNSFNDKAAVAGDPSANPPTPGTPFTPGPINEPISDKDVNIVPHKPFIELVAKAQHDPKLGKADEKSATTIIDEWFKPKTNPFLKAGGSDAEIDMIFDDASSVDELSLSDYGADDLSDVEGQGEGGNIESPPPVNGGGGDSESFDVDRFYQQFYDRQVGDRALSEASDVSSLSTDLESLISEEV